MSIFHGKEDYAQCSKGAPLRSLRSLCFAKGETAPSCKRKRSVGNSGRCVKQRAKKGYGKKRKCYKYVKKNPAEIANQSESTCC